MEFLGAGDGEDDASLFESLERLDGLQQLRLKPFRVRTKKAAERKTRGNESFKKRDFAKATRAYLEALWLLRDAPVFDDMPPASDVPDGAEAAARPRGAHRCSGPSRRNFDAIRSPGLDGRYRAGRAPRAARRRRRRRRGSKKSAARERRRRGLAAGRFCAGARGRRGDRPARRPNCDFVARGVERACS